MTIHMIRSQSYKRVLSLIFFDLAALFFSFLLAAFLWSGSWTYDYVIHPIFFLTLFVYLSLFYIFYFYSPFKYFNPRQTLFDVFVCLTIGALVLAATSFFIRIFLIPRSIFVLSILFFGCFVFIGRIFYNGFLGLSVLAEKALIIGTGPVAHAVFECINQKPYLGIKVIDFVQTAEILHRGKQPDPPSSGISSQLTLQLGLRSAQVAIIALEPDEYSYESEVIAAVLEEPVRILSAISVFEHLNGTIPPNIVSERYLLDFVTQLESRRYFRMKRILDLLFSVIFSLLLLPIFLIAVFVLFCTSGAKRIFYVQSRTGKGGILFNLIKFRTMEEKAGEGKRVTFIGKWLRRYRIDEIPQLWNVLKGNMSLVGPRPEISIFVDRSSQKMPFYKVIFTLKPGLTGWAQIQSSYSTSEEDYERKFSYDLYYLKNMSFGLDVAILLKTIRIVLLGRGQ